MGDYNTRLDDRIDAMDAQRYYLPRDISPSGSHRNPIPRHMEISTPEYVEPPSTFHWLPANSPTLDGSISDGNTEIETSSKLSTVVFPSDEKWNKEEKKKGPSSQTLELDDDFKPRAVRKVDVFDKNGGTTTRTIVCPLTSRTPRLSCSLSSPPSRPSSPFRHCRSSCPLSVGYKANGNTCPPNNFNALIDEMVKRETVPQTNIKVQMTTTTAPETDVVWRAPLQEQLYGRQLERRSFRWKP